MSQAKRKTEYEAPRGVESKRITGKRAGHEIHLEIEDVLDKINKSKLLFNVK